MRNLEKIKQICSELKERLESKHITCFTNETIPVLLVSEHYNGVWMEHLYDSIFLAKMDPSKLFVAEGNVRFFIQKQTADGQLPCYIKDGHRVRCIPNEETGYFQIQECVSFARLCFEVYQLNRDRAFLAECYEACKKWDTWLRKNRMTTGRGLIEAFVGYDMGHDNSSRLDGFSCRGNYRKDGVRQNAAVLPPEDGITPMLATDMNCNFYATQIALANMAKELARDSEAEAYLARAKEIKQNLFAQCFHREDAFFYDVDKNGNQRKIRSCTIFHFFMEHVLDPEEDAALIDEIYHRYIKNPKEFWTPYPFPSTSVSDPAWRKNTKNNCWSYFSEGLLALRCTLWMDDYGYGEDLDCICEKWLDAWSACDDRFRCGQELDPISGEPSDCSDNYTPTMLLYLYSAKRLGIIK